MNGAFTMAKLNRKDLLKETIKHIDIKEHPGILQVVDSMQHMAFSSRELYRAADIFDRMIRDPECSIILTLAGSLISAGLKKVIVDLVRNNMVDAIVSTGANIVDQDFFEALGFKHYIGTQFIDDTILRDLHIDRIYDTFIDEDQLRVCDDTTREIADSMPPKAYSSREFIKEMGRYLEKNAKDKESIVLECYKPRRSDLLPRLLRLLRRLRSARPPGQPPRRPHLHRLRQGFPRAHPDQADEQGNGHLHDRRRRAQEFHAGHRRRGGNPR